MPVNLESINHKKLAHGIAVLTSPNSDRCIVVLTDKATDCVSFIELSLAGTRLLATTIDDVAKHMALALAKEGPNPKH